MNLSLFIAKRYFLSKRKKNFINIISILSMIGVAIATAALIIVLSVFNGLEDLLRSLYTSFDPQLKIELVQGKSFTLGNELLQKVKSVNGVEIVTEVIEDYAYVRYRDADMIATIKGVSDNFIDQKRLVGHIDEGELKLHDKGINFAILGRGVSNTLSVALDAEMYALQIFYIKNVKSSILDPSKLYSQKSIRPGAVFAIEKNFDDNYIFLPLEFAKELLNYGDKRTSLEVKIKSNANLQAVQNSLKEVLGSSFTVLSNEEQHKDLYRILKIEKLFTFLALAMLIAVGSLNIFFSLMMLALDKKKDISVLIALGATHQFIRKIFINEGAVIAFVGAGAGLFIGALICLLQDKMGMVGMGMESGIVANYPVKMRLLDFVSISAAIFLITVSVSIYPARLASKFYHVKHL